MASSLDPRGGPIEGINVTPLVDVVLVLLVIFMVTAKLVVTPALPLDLPQASQTEEVQTILAVALGADGALAVDGERVSEGQLGERAAAALERDPDLRAVLQADGDVPHRRVIAVLDLLKATGLTRVAFGTVLPDAEGGAADGT